MPTTSAILALAVLLIGGMVGSMENGWGFFEPYIISYMRLYDSTITTSKVRFFYTISLVAEFLGCICLSVVIW